MQAAVKGKDPKPEGFAGASRALAPPGAPPRGVCCDVPCPGSSPGGSLSRRAFCPQGHPRPTPGWQRERPHPEAEFQKGTNPHAQPPSHGASAPQSETQTSAWRTTVAISCALAPLPRGQEQLLARPALWLPFRVPFPKLLSKGRKNCWRLLCPGSFSEFLCKAPFQGDQKIAGVSCALAPFQDSFFKLLSKEARTLLARPVPWLLFRIPFQSPKKIAGASFHSCPKAGQACWRCLIAGPCHTEANAIYHTGPRQDITNKTLGTKP